jgi:hypothetical protein
MRFYAALAFLCLFCGFAQADSPYAAPLGFYLVSSNLAKPVQYSPTSASANWEITQSGAASSLPNFTPGGSIWATQDSQEAVSVSDTQGTWTETIAQLGNACNRGEFDSFIQPAAQANNGVVESLGQIPVLDVQGSVTLIEQHANSAPACADNHATSSYGIVLMDTSVYPNQRLSYSLKLAAFCIGNCHPQWKTASWFWNGADHVTTVRGVTTFNYGVSDVPVAVGAAQLTQVGIAQN